MVLVGDIAPHASRPRLPMKQRLWRSQRGAVALARSNWTAAVSWLTNAGAFEMEAAKIYFIVFGLLTIAGGVVGYVKAGSAASIIAGAVTGVLLLIAAFLLPEHQAWGLGTALIVSLLLAGYFIRKYLQTATVMPSGMMSVLSVIGIIAAILAWVRK
jgi:uncharacterized membrane protein (UPF0136 family)